MMNVVKGLKWIFSNVMSPWNLSDMLSTAFLAMAVCTCGSWRISDVANVKAMMETIVSQNIFNALLIYLPFYMSNLQK
jgi:hypothetical protein